jgi:short-subunit dehydrogenase
MQEKRSIFITGCSSGIGLCSAIYLKEKGFQVFPSARKPQDIEALKQLGFDPITLDMSDSQSIDQAVKTLLEKTGGKIYGLINNAGYVEPGSALQLSRETLQKQFDTNVFGLHELTRALLPTMEAAQEGRIIHVSSVLGFVSKAYLGAYNASKYAVEGLADTLRLELFPYKNIHVSLVQPGPIETKIYQNAVHALEHRQQQTHNKQDKSLLQAMQNDNSKTSFKLPPEAVAKAFEKALTAKNPKARYRVTTPCKVAALAKRLLSDRMLDRMLMATDPDAPQKLLPK